MNTKSKIFAIALAASALAASVVTPSFAAQLWPTGYSNVQNGYGFIQHEPRVTDSGYVGPSGE
jgi:hypothetical protein